MIDADGNVLAIATGEFGPRFGEATVSVNTLIADSVQETYWATVFGPSEDEVLTRCFDLFFSDDQPFSCTFGLTRVITTVEVTKLIDISAATKPSDD